MVKEVKKESVSGGRLSRRFNKLRVRAGDLEQKGIVYIGHLPRGFEEEELKKFFAQFGKVSKLRVARSKKSARTKGYAFLEFEQKEVAEIAVKTMQGYLMFGKKIECHLVDQPHKDTFKHGNRDWKFVPNQVIKRNKLNAEKTPKQRKERVEGLLAKEKEKRNRLKELGIGYEFPGYTALVDKVRKDEPAFKQKRRG